jgi:integrase
MSLYKRGKVWWYKFTFASQTIRETSKSSSKTLARDAERIRRREVEEGFNGVQKAARAQLFSVAAERWLQIKRTHLAPRSVNIEQHNLKHLKPVFGAMLLTDITADDVAIYQSRRLNEGASPKTVNLEVGTVRAILKRNRLWGNVQPDVRMLKTRDDVGRALTQDEECALLAACRESRSASLYIAVEIALTTCMRYSEIRLLRWEQINLAKGELRVGKSKTEYGDGRVIPLSERLKSIVGFWAARFPNRTPSHYVFPSERYGGKGKDDVFGFSGAVAYRTDPTAPIGDWKEAWEAAKKRAGKALYRELDAPEPLRCRFHDLRHTGCTRMLEAGVPFAVVSDIMGWSTSTAIRMVRRYGHIGHSARRDAVNKLSGTTTFDSAGAQKWAHWVEGTAENFQ